MRIHRETNINPSTIKSFVETYEKTGHIINTMGRPTIIDKNMKDRVVEFIQQTPDSFLYEVAAEFGISISSVRLILLEAGIFHFNKTPVPVLTIKHKADRVNFARQFTRLNYSQLPIIIFTDESSVELKLARPGVWRRPGEHPPESFLPTAQRSLHVMVWGGIGPRGYRTKLIVITETLNSKKYTEFIKKEVFPEIRERFGDYFIFQQDGAPSHSSKYTMKKLFDIDVKNKTPSTPQEEEEEDTWYPDTIEWPAHSPDLSPIEHIWDYMKDQLYGMNDIKTKNDLATALFIIWNKIPDEVIHNCYSSFLARCKVCARINGESLNGHWKEVNEEHDMYRRRLVIDNDPNSTEVYKEVP